MKYIVHSMIWILLMTFGPPNFVLAMSSKHQINQHKMVERATAHINSNKVLQRILYDHTCCDNFEAAKKQVIKDTELLSDAKCCEANCLCMSGHLKTQLNSHSIQSIFVLISTQSVPVSVNQRYNNASITLTKRPPKN